MIVFVYEIDSYFVFDKNNLYKKFQNETEKKIEPEDIPKNSKIKRFMIGWN